VGKKIKKDREGAQWNQEEGDERFDVFDEPQALRVLRFIDADLPECNS